MIAQHAPSSVLVFATGGTIGMRDTERGLAPDPDFPEALESMVAGICAPAGIEFRVNHLQPPIDSSNADAETAAKIARAIRARARTQHPRGIVITHGTDTLAYTAARLAFELADLRVPVVLTGSQLPHGYPGSDAKPNLVLAVRTAVRARAGSPVSIAFGGEIVPAVRATKTHSTGLKAFRAELPLATGAAGPPAPAPVSPARPARVISFRFVPGMEDRDLVGAVAGEPDGLVLETYGAGNGPLARYGVRSALQDISSRIPVVAITQCAAGGVSLDRYAAGLAGIGVIDGSDLTVEAAVSKLAFLLDAGHAGDELRALMERNLVGECAGVSP